MIRDFQSFIERLESAGELKRVSARVDPYLEMAAIADRVAKQPLGGSALLFEHPKDSQIPVAMNVYGSRRRMEMALGLDNNKCGLDYIGDRIEKLLVI